MPALTIVPAATIHLRIEVGQGPAGPRGAGAWTAGSITAMSYDDADRLIGYQQDGDPFSVTYPDPLHIVIAGPGRTKTVTLSAPDRILSIVTT